MGHPKEHRKGLEKEVEAARAALAALLSERREGLKEWRQRDKELSGKIVDARDTLVRLEGELRHWGHDA